jgi:1,4-alpha-glucan branching enzyme
MLADTFPFKQIHQLMAVLPVDPVIYVNHVYFDSDKHAVRSYFKSLLSYYIEGFHGDGVYVSDTEFNKQLQKEFPDKRFIYKNDENLTHIASEQYISAIIENYNSGFDHKTFVNTPIESDTYVIYDYNKCIKLIKGDEKIKKTIARMLLGLAYINSAFKISVYNENAEYLYALERVSNLYANSKALNGKNKTNILYNGKKNKIFAYEYISKNDYVLEVINFGQEEDEKFDLGMQYYGYYKLILDTKDNLDSKELYYTRGKKAHNKNIALQMHIKPNQVLVYKRMKDI